MELVSSGVGSCAWAKTPPARAPRRSPSTPLDGNGFLNLHHPSPFSIRASKRALAHLRARFGVQLGDDTVERGDKAMLHLHRFERDQLLALGHGLARCTSTAMILPGMGR